MCSVNDFNLNLNRTSSCTFSTNDQYFSDILNYINIINVVYNIQEILVLADLQHSGKCRTFIVCCRMNSDFYFKKNINKKTQNSKNSVYKK